MSFLNREASYFSFILFSRILLGVIFVASGFEKLFYPPEEFMVVLRGYHLFPEILIRPISTYLPWLELLFGLFLLMGLFYHLSLYMIGLFLLLFTLAIASTLLRGISLEDCGCFKSIGIKENGPTALIRNVVLLLFWLNLYLYKGERWTIDKWIKERD